MSGGAFDYAQHRIADIYTEIEDEIYGHHLDDEFDVNRYIEDHWLEDSEKEYIRSIIIQYLIVASILRKPSRSSRKV
nr:MAG TPA: hypothetical protein [Caudoviricetes sp.]